MLSSLLEVFSDLTTAALSLFPHRTVIAANERAVKWKAGAMPTEGGPGVVWWWPWRTELEVVEVGRQFLAVDVDHQAAGANWTTSVAISYRIADAACARLVAVDFELALDDLVRGAVYTKISGLVDGIPEESQKSLLEYVQGAMGHFGIEVLTAQIHGSIRTRGVRVVGMEPTGSE